jgi:hypothetical protein
VGAGAPGRGLTIAIHILSIGSEGTLVAPLKIVSRNVARGRKEPKMADQARQKDNKDAQSGEPVQLDKEQQGGQQQGGQQQGGKQQPGGQQHQGGQQMPGREQQQGGKH